MKKLTFLSHPAVSPDSRKYQKIFLAAPNVWILRKKIDIKYLNMI